jgi:mannosyl-3-phosphoglycerate phosphatase
MSDFSSIPETEVLKAQVAIFTDLDATLLDHTTYSHAPATTALARAEAQHIPVIPVTSKSNPEIRKLRQAVSAIGNNPAIIENGGGIVIPKKFMSMLPQGILSDNNVQDDGDNWTIQIAKPIAEARIALAQTSQELGVSIEALGDMTSERFSEITGLSPEDSALALERQFQEGFRLADQSKTPEDIEAIKAQMGATLKEKGFNLTFGGRFWQVTGGSDKGEAVELLKKILTVKYGKIHTIGLGDASGDMPALIRCDEGYLINNPHKAGDAIDLTAYPHISKVDEPGPVGWNIAVNNALDRLSNQN